MFDLKAACIHKAIDVHSYAFERPEPKISSTGCSIHVCFLLFVTFFIVSVCRGENNSVFPCACLIFFSNTFLEDLETFFKKKKFTSMTQRKRNKKKICIVFFHINEIAALDATLSGQNF